MTTQQLSFSVLTAPLAALDRRALSQAWYSALHLARDAARPPAAPFVPVPQASAEPGLPRRAATAARASHPRTPAAAPPRERAETRAAEPDRRADRSALARKIERAFLRPSRPARRATFAIEGSNARIHVTLQTLKTGTRLIAVCPSRVRGPVARALEEARYALAARGIALAVAFAEA